VQQIAVDALLLDVLLDLSLVGVHRQQFWWLAQGKHLGDRRALLYRA
jgi:hypothetical protein